MAIKQRKSQSVLSKFVFFIVAVAILWSGAWFFLSQVAWSFFDEMIGKIATHHWALSCGGRNTQGYPLSLEMTCRQVGLQQQDGNKIDGNLAQLSSKVSILSPNKFIFSPKSPLALQLGGAGAFTADWQSATLVTSSRLTPIPGMSLSVHGLTVTTSGQKPQNALSVTANSFEASLAQPDVNSHAPVHLTVKDVKSDLLDALSDGSAQLDLTVNGFIASANMLTGSTVPMQVEAWRTAGGQIEIETLEMNMNQLHVLAQGHFGLDDSHRLTGEGMVSIAGADVIAKKLGLPIPSGNTATILQSLTMKNASDKPKLDAGPAAINLPVRLAEGRVFIGPIPLKVFLPPLY